MAYKETGELKKRAWLAKQRLKMGYWESVKTSYSDANGSDGDARYTTAEYVRAKLRRDVESGGKTVEQDEKMYRKVCDILDSDEVAINPIGQLIDGEVYQKLDAAAKQRYVLELSNKFGELKERYYRERNRA